MVVLGRRFLAPGLIGFFDSLRKDAPGVEREQRQATRTFLGARGGRDAVRAAAASLHAAEAALRGA